MTPSQLASKLKRLELTFKRRQLADARKARAKARGQLKDYYLSDAARCDTLAANAAKHCVALPYGPKRGTFKGCNGNLEFDPTTNVGTSYQWYEITKRVERIQLVNTFRYSVTTASHVEVIQGLLTQLGVKYVEIEAPKGLQDLQAALIHHTYAYAKVKLAESHMRTKPDQSSQRYRGSKYHARAIATLAKLGFKMPASAIATAAELAEIDRNEKLARARANRMRIVDNATEADLDKAGYHVIRSEGYLGRHERSELTKEALAKGFHALFIHRAKGLELIQGGAA